jgi:predicted  nucleic acid-binding Zn-ribbon protein
MEDLRTKIASERARMNRLEDEALAMMSAIETARGDVARAQANLEPLEASLHEQVAATAREIADTEAGQLASLRGERARLAAAAAPYALVQYEALRASFPNPVVPIDHGTCGGCRIRISANTSERVRAAREIVTCEHCSRILFVS